ncbi:hypothetical protein QGN29_03950 [Temperatibacter marinus]|uniref:Uncharacterized protein n=1 Tax=Temperatibacter marinus TaxID=1456591 RepID=A0AA52EF09_9PROT|nr:hypothetical protein [Temperatibacter marinus]WND03525.1 hypothetical protein QGN29_03950 [Temperatibacter marinus]
MTEAYPTFPIGSVGYNLMLMRGTWHDHVETYALDGTPLSDDPKAGTPGPSPFDNLVYLDFDGHKMSLTNVHIRGRETTAKTFTGYLKEGVLVFDQLGPGAYENIGMSGGPGILTFNSRRLEKACDIYMEPDFIMLTAPGERLRHTVLYKDGEAIRTLTAKGTRLSPTCQKRHDLDPRGPDGPVHEKAFVTQMWSELA